MQYTNLANLGVFESLDSIRAIFLEGSSHSKKLRGNLMFGAGLKLLDYLLADVLLLEPFQLGQQHIPLTVLGKMHACFKLAEQNPQLNRDLCVRSDMFSSLRMDIEKKLSRMTTPASPKANPPQVSNAIPIRTLSDDGDSMSAKVFYDDLIVLCDEVERTLQHLENQLEEY